MATNEVSITVRYSDASERDIGLGSCADSIISGVEAAAQAVNGSIEGGTDGGLANFMVSDGGANMVKISQVKVVTTEVTNLE